MSIDMSSAFDTINRQTVLNVLDDAGCTDDEIKMVRLLLSNTILKIKVNNSFSVEFQSTTGAFQGDALSGNLLSLKLLRSIISGLYFLKYQLHLTR